MVELDEEMIDKELEYLVTAYEAVDFPTVENPRKALRLRTQNKTRREGRRGGMAGESDSNLDSLAAEARNTAERKIYDAVEGIEL